MKLSMLIFITIGAKHVVNPAKSEVMVNRLYTGGQMLSQCESESEYQVICLGYLSGIYDLHNVYSASGFPQKICPPKRTNAVQLWRIFVKYANENPQKDHLAAASIGINIFKEAFPC